MHTCFFPIPILNICLYLWISIVLELCFVDKIVFLWESSYSPSDNYSSGGLDLTSTSCHLLHSLQDPERRGGKFLLSDDNWVNLIMVLGSCKMDFGHWCFQWVDEWRGLWSGREQEASEFSSANFNKERRGIYSATVSWPWLPFLFSSPCFFFLTKLPHSHQETSPTTYMYKLLNH